MKYKFPFNHDDVVSFPDTETECVDVGCDEFGAMMMPVAQTEYPNLMIVEKRGRGFRFVLEYGESEIFRRNRRTGKYISTKEYLGYFGNYSDLKFVCRKKELHK